MESAAGYLPGRTLDQHMTLAYIYTCSGWDWWICLTLYVSLLQDGLTALYFASFKNHLDVVKFLLQRGAQVNKVQHCNLMYISACSVAANLKLACG